MTVANRTPRERRTSVQRDVASTLDRYRAELDVDQQELATAIGCSPTYVRRMLERSDGTTLDLADVAMMAGGPPGVAKLGEDLVRWLAARYGLVVVVAGACTEAPTVPAADVAAEGGALPKLVGTALADGRIDPVEGERIERHLRVVEGAVSRTRAAIGRANR